MSKRFLAVAVFALVVSSAPAAFAKPILMPTVSKEVKTQKAIWSNHVFAPKGKLQPPAPPCPESGRLPSPFSNCGLPEFPATTLPVPGNMANWGGHVQVTPKEYIVYWGWGEKGAFPATQPCRSERIAEGSTTATLACDPDGAGKYMADWVYQLGGTQWAGVQTQYYQSVQDPAGQSYNQYITNPSNQLAGIWVDDHNDIT